MISGPMPTGHPMVMAKSGIANGMFTSTRW